MSIGSISIGITIRMRHLHGEGRYVKVSAQNAIYPIDLLQYNYFLRYKTSGQLVRTYGNLASWVSLVTFPSLWPYRRGGVLQQKR